MKLKMIWILGILSFVLLPVIASFAEEQTDPVPQLSVPCEVTDIYDGDTLWVMVRVPIKVRLLDCWAPEIKGTKGAEHQAALKGITKEEVARVTTANAQELFGI